MKGRWVALGIVVGIALALSVGFAFGAGRSNPGAEPSPSGTTSWWAAMDAMHDSPWMEQMRQQMGPEWAAQCDAMHEQMAQWMEQNGYGQEGPGGGMMGGGSGSGPGGGMMGGGSGSGPGGMMGGSGSGMMGQ